MDHKLVKIARTGYVAKGSVYAIAGVLTLMASFNLGGQKTGKLQVLQFLDKQPFGNALLVILALGLLCYASWRLFQAISDPEGISANKNGKLKRIAFFASGCIYIGLAILAILRVINAGNTGGSSTSSENTSFLASEIGLIVIGIIGAILIFIGLFQFYKIYKETFWRKFDEKSKMEEKRRKTIKNSAVFGLSSRGILFIIIGYFAVRAAITSNPSKIKTTTEAFSFLRESAFGAWLMGIVAAGLIGYAIYMFMTAKYRKFND
ncbi:MAG TPA: DUF1206 domain-containing protein [Salinimicrobium sp.]|nr:DUF1206 domain-containing protein [Salinimicrobium sp.]